MPTHFDTTDTDRQMANKKNNFIQPYELNFSDLSSKNCVPSSSFEKPDFHSSSVKGSTQVYHKFRTPPELNEAGKMAIAMPHRRQGPIHIHANDDGGRSHDSHIEVYGDYGKHYAAAKREIDAMTMYCNKETPAAELKQLLYESIRKARPGVKDTVIDAAYEENVFDADLTLELFAQVAFALLMPSYLATDKVANDIMRVCDAMTSGYAAWVDKNTKHKQKIYTLIGIDSSELKQSCAPLINPIYKQEKYPGDHPTLAGRVNYEKSPSIKCRIHEWKPEEKDRKASDIVIDQTGKILLTKVWDMRSQQICVKEPCSTYEQFEVFTYTVGDSKSGKKKSFKMMGKNVLMNPTGYWGAQKKRCDIHFTTDDLKVYQIIPFAGMGRQLSVDKVAQEMADARQARLELGIDADDVVVDPTDDPQQPNETIVAEDNQKKRPAGANDPEPGFKAAEKKARFGD